MSSDIRFEINPRPLPTAESVLELFAKTGLARPNWSPNRMSAALQNASLIVCAWHNEELVGFARAISDFVWIGYLSQLAVAPDYQMRGIGRRLVDCILNEFGAGVSLVVHSADDAMGFYEAAGFERNSNMYQIRRKT